MGFLNCQKVTIAERHNLFLLEMYEKDKYELGKIQDVLRILYLKHKYVVALHIEICFVSKSQK